MKKDYVVSRFAVHLPIFMSSKNRAAALLISLLLITASFAGAQTQFSAWASGLTTIKLGRKTLLQNDLSFRSSDQVKHLQTLLIRPGIGFRFTPHWRVSAGYSWALSRKSVGDQYVHEPDHAVWEQLWYQHSWPSGQSPKASLLFFTGRLMYEQRFIPKLTLQNNQVKTVGHDFATRLRILARSMLPLKPGPEFVKGQYLVLQNECFLHLSGKDLFYGKTFDQNRTALATGYRFSRKFDAEISYMFRYAATADAVRDHTLQMVSFLRL